MTEKQASSEIAQSRERFEKWAFRGKQDGVPAKFYLLEFDKLSLNPVQYKDELTQAAFAIWEQAERDTRERIANLVKLVLIQVTGPDGFLVKPKELEELLAERIRGKE